MSTQEGQNGQSTQAFLEIASSAIDIVRSAGKVNPSVRHAVETLQQAAVAAKAQEHDDALGLLRDGLGGPVVATIRSELPKIIRSSVQQAISSRFPELVTDALRDHLSEEVVERLCQEVLQAHLDERESLSDRISKLTAAIESQTNAVTRLTQAGIEEAIYNIVAPGFLARIRDQDSVKTEIGRRVAEVFFSNQRRPAFVLASSTAVHLGLQLRRLPTVMGTLFYTNSVAFPLAALNDCSPHEVCTFCGRNYDDNCGGWLPNVGDEPFFDALRNCFHPNSYGLTTAVITPKKLSIEHGMRFMRPEAARMARVLVESAQETILMLPADRLARALELPEQASAFPNGGNWQGLGKRIHVVIAGTCEQTDVGSLVESLSQQGLNVHLQPGESTTWKVQAGSQP